MNYYLGRFLFRIIFKTLFRFKVIGKSNLPEGGFIIASNHNSLIDPPLVGSALKQPVYFMAKKELFRIPVFGTIISSTHAFPIDREYPVMSSIRKAINLLKSGKVLLVFPEGTRKLEAKKIRGGVALLAHKANVPVVPSRIYNNQNIVKLPTLKYVIGEPVKFMLKPNERASSRKYSQFSSLIMEKIRSL